MGKYFGTDGFRGEANVNLTVDHAFKVGRFLGWYYGRDKEDGKAKIVIGKDTRRSSYMFEYALVFEEVDDPKVKEIPIEYFKHSVRHFPDVTCLLQTAIQIFLMHFRVSV